MESEAKPTLDNLTKHCLRQVINALAPGILNQTSLVAKVTTFCGELAEAASPKLKRKLGADAPLVQSLDISRFVEGAITPSDFCNLLEQAMLREEAGRIDNATVQGICYKYYSGEKTGEIKFPKWLSATCTYRLWMVFCVLIEDDYLTVTKETFTGFLKRLMELSSFSWRDEPEIFGANERFEFPMFLDAITVCFEKFKMDRSLACEVIEDIHDEYVCGVLKKGYLIKKGHVRKNFKKRWFVLQRTIMSYYVSRKNMEKKGELVLNAKTEVRSIPDDKEKKYRFIVSCGGTGKVFELFADNQGSKQQWMTAVNKAIALARALEQGFESSVKEFYAIKYGTDDPRLRREDSELRRGRFLTNKDSKWTRASSAAPDIATPTDIPRNPSLDSNCSANNIELDEKDDEDEDDDEDEYLPMEPLHSNSIAEDDDMEVYEEMSEAPNAMMSLLATPREPALRPSSSPLPPVRPVANNDPPVSAGPPLNLPMDERGYIYLDNQMIADLLNTKNAGGEGRDLGEGSPDDLYEEPRLVSPPTAGQPPGEVGGQKGLPDDPNLEDDVYEESSFIFQPPNQSAKSAGQKIEQRVESGDSHSPSPGDHGDIYMDANLMSRTLNNYVGVGQEAEQSVTDEGNESYGSWNILRDAKASSVLSTLLTPPPPQGAKSPSMKVADHPKIKLLAAVEGRDSTSPEDVETWAPRQVTPKDLESPPANRTKSLLQISSEPVVSQDGDANYNYVSWELLNQPNAAMGSNLHTAGATPTSESPNSYLKITHMSGHPSSLEPNSPPSPEPHPSIHSVGSPIYFSSPQTEAFFFPGGGPPNSAGLPLTPSDSSTTTSNNAHLYVNLDDIPIVPEVPPVPSRDKRASKPDISDIGPTPPPRTAATTTGAGKKKPLPNPRHTVISQSLENVQ